MEDLLVFLLFKVKVATLTHEQQALVRAVCIRAIALREKGARKGAPIQRTGWFPVTYQTVVKNSIRMGARTPGAVMATE